MNPGRSVLECIVQALTPSLELGLRLMPPGQGLHKECG